MNSKKKNLSKEQVNEVMTLYSNGDFHKAIEEIKELNIEFPNVPLLFNLIGACYKEIGQLEGAIKMFEVAVNLNSDYAEAHFNLGAMHKILGQDTAAIASYKRAIEIIPNYPDAHNNLGSALHEIGRYDSAIESFEWAVAYNPNFAEAYNNLGRLQGDMGKTKEAIESFKKAIRINPSYSNAYYNLASAFQDLGKIEDCLKSVEKAVEYRPSWGEAHLMLSRIKKYYLNDPHLTQMLSLIDNNELSLIDQIAINFALAYGYEQLGMSDEQFKYLNEANALRKKESGYTIETDKVRFKKIKSAFKSPIPIVNKLDLQTNSLRPIFIVGMPRSGTSLVHQILDSHKNVFGAGELTAMSPIINDFFKEKKNIKEVTYKSVLSIREKYLDSLSKLNAKEEILIDKMPLNFRHIGFIFSAFPEAKVIHMKRDPMATCWSIYKYYFNGNFYSYNQKDLAKYFSLYEDLMKFWNKLFPNKIFDVIYEELTLNQENETRDILDYCELEWDPNCLKFYENKKAVKTTSSLQVRKKMYQGSSEAWKKYEEYLQPLINSLNK
jgi:tetratricopeptide (TPR) repeat protein